MAPPRELAVRIAPGRLFDFSFAFSCVFAGLFVIGHVLGPLYVRAHLALGSLLVPSAPLASGVTLALLGGSAQPVAEPWQVTLLATPALGSPALVPIDLRVLSFLPTAAFVALAVATPFSSWTRNARLLLVGLPLLQLLLVGLVATPLLSFLGGTGPVRAFVLSRGTHTLLQIVYRALVAPPGMAFALPFLLWLLLMSALGQADWTSENRRAGFDFRWLRTPSARKRS